MSLDRDWQIRLAAMRRLEVLQARGQGLVNSVDLDAGFEFEGEKIPLWSKARGIWRPRQLQDPGAALTIVTAPRVRGRQPLYDDEVAADDRGWFGYKYEGADPATWTNQAVRLAGVMGRPLIYLYGVSPRVYKPIFPVLVTNDDPSALTFRIEADVSLAVLDPASPARLGAEARRQYQTAVVKRRLHQHRFRELVLEAYARRCTMCQLAHTVLLDAAHIIPDKDDRGLPLISNGLAMCKIHHSAYDAGILGVAPDLIIHVREDVLRELDGPMLEHGLKAMAGRSIKTPRAASDRPNPDFLAERFSRFEAA